MTMMIKKNIKKFGQTEKDSISFASNRRMRGTRAGHSRANATRKELEPAVEDEEIEG